MPPLSDNGVPATRGRSGASYLVQDHYQSLVRPCQVLFEPEVLKQELRAHGPAELEGDRGGHPAAG